MGADKTKSLYESIKQDLKTHILMKRQVEGNISKLEEQLKKDIEVIRNRVEEYFKDNIDCREAKRGKVRGALRKSIDRLGKKETLLERVFVASSENVFNQFNLMSGLTSAKLDSQTRRMNIDLVVTDKGRVIKEMIELKDKANKKDDPLLAMFELIMYYFIFINAKKKDDNYPMATKKIKLIILAQKEYYSSFSNYDDNTLTVIARCASSKIKSVVISFQEFQIKEKDLESAKNILGTFKSIFNTRKRRGK